MSLKEREQWRKVTGELSTESFIQTAFMTWMVVRMTSNQGSTRSVVATTRFQSNRAGRARVKVRRRDYVHGRWRERCVSHSSLFNICLHLSPSSCHHYKHHGCPLCRSRQGGIVSFAFALEQHLVFQHVPLMNFMTN